MKKLIQFTVCFLVFAPIAAFSQYVLDQKASNLEIQGTSTLHDWEIQAEKMEGKVSADVSTEKINVKSLSFSVVVKELKSGKGGMDKNTFKALEEDKFPKITYSLTSVDRQKFLEDNEYELSTTGTLTIAGNSNTIKMNVIATPIQNSITFVGEYKMKMTDFKIDPPVAMFGTIKTGDEVVISFKVQYNK